MVLGDTCPKVHGIATGPTILFLSGFPDDHYSAWDYQKMIDELGGTHQLAFLPFPEFNRDQCAFKPWGYSFDVGAQYRIGRLQLGLNLQDVAGMYQSWTVNAARLAIAAPWAVLAMMATTDSALLAYRAPVGVVILAVGGAMSILAYRAMVHLGRLPEEVRVLR